MKTRIIFIIIIFVVFISEMLGQIISERKYDPNKVVRHALENAVQVKYGNNYKIYYHIMDSLIVNSPPNEISDPYGTLAGCVLFSAWHRWQSKDSVVTGIYKNGQIIWDDYPGTKAGFGSELLIAKDINNDGEVDVLEAEYDQTLTYREGPGVSYLWILSWNGTRGKMINDIDPTTKQSMLVSTGGWYDYVDINRNSILVIRGEIDSVWQGDFPNLNPATLPNITYSWDGSKYGFFPSAHQINANEFYPADLMGVSMRCNVINENTKFIYNYSITNQPTSKQSIDNIYVGELEDTSSVYTPNGWIASDPRYFQGRLFYNATLDYWGALSPGHSIYGFGTVSTSLPMIVKYYVQGFRSFTQIATDEEYRNDIYTNSVSGCTLGSSDTVQKFVPLNFLDTLMSYTTQSRTLGWIKDQPTANKYLGYFALAKTSLGQNNITSTRTTLQRVLTDVNVDSTVNLTSEAYALIRYNTEYLLAQLPTAPLPGLFIKLVNSTGSLLANGTLQYRDSTWKDVTNNNDGTFTITTTRKKISLRMTYEYGTQTKSNVPVKNDTTIIFQTKNVTADLQTSSGNPLDTGIVQYNAGGWKDFGATTNGVVTKELLPIKYTFKMTYNNASIEKKQNIDSNAVVLFQTVNASVQLKNSSGNFIDQGVVQYNAGGWKDFGITSNGNVQKELLPAKYNFKMTYASASKNQAQDLDSNTIVVFQTSNVSVQLKNGQGLPLDTGVVQYNAGGWKDFGTTVNGITNKELLPVKYTFRITYGYANNEKAQNTDSNVVVTFQTVNAVVQLQNSQGSLMDTGIVQYNAGGWKNFGTTTSGMASKELLANKYNFRMTYAFANKDKQQDIGTNPIIVFQTINTIVQLQNSQGSPLDTGTVQYNAGGWKNFGTTTNGIASKQLLANQYNFRMTYASINNDKTQNLDSSNIVNFSTVLCIVRVTNSSGQLVSNAIVTYNASGWKTFGTTVNGIATKELLPANITFRVQSGKTKQDKAQDITTNPNVEFSLP
ncbi:MAG: hypothetical protein ABSD46_03870 [Bacteroidota bacterium]